jgi:hypothetical protein
MKDFNVETYLSSLASGLYSHSLSEKNKKLTVVILPTSKYRINNINEKQKHCNKINVNIYSAYVYELFKE